MAIPQLRSEGTDQTGTAAFTVSFAGWTWAANDILEIAIATDGWVPVPTTANGFVLAQDPSGATTASVTTNGGVNSASDVGIFVFWKRAVGSTTTTDPAPIFPAPPAGGCWCLEPNSYSGARTVGTPYDQIQTAIVTTATTSIAPPAVTTTNANSLVMTRVGGGNDDSAFNNWTMTGSSGPAAGVPSSGWHAPGGNTCSFTGVDGGYATAGGPHAGTSTFALAAKQAQLTLVMSSIALPVSLNASAALIGASGLTSATTTIPVTAAAGALGESGLTSGSAAVKLTASAAVLGDPGTIVATTGASTSTANAAIQGAPGVASATGSIPLTASATVLGAPGATNATASTIGTLALGVVGIRQKANTTTPNTGTVTTYPVYPAWQPSHLYTLSDAIRVSNGGNCYELTITSPGASGTSAASGGPTGTGANIADGGCHWNFLDTGNATTNSQASGSFFLASCAWGRDATGGAIPTDSKSNTWTQLAKRFYAGFPPSSAAIYAATNPAIGGAAHTLTDAYGLGGDGGGDETTLILVEIKNGSLVKAFSQAEVSPVSNVCTSLSVTTTGPAILVAFWWLNGVVRTSGTNHDAVPGSGFTAIPEGTALMEIGPSGAGEVQVATHYRSVSAPGTYTASITTTGGEGAIVYLIAVQASDPPPGATASASVIGEPGAVLAAAQAAVRAGAAAMGEAGAAASSAQAAIRISASAAGAPGTISAGSTHPATASAALIGAGGITNITATVAASPSTATAAILGDSGRMAGAIVVGADRVIIAGMLGGAGAVSSAAAGTISLSATARGGHGIVSSTVTSTGSASPVVRLSPKVTASADELLTVVATI